MQKNRNRKKVIQKKSEIILTNPKILIPARLKFIKCYVWSTLLYVVEKRTIRTMSHQRLESFKMWTIRSILRISWIRRITNEEVICIAGTIRLLFETIKKNNTHFLVISCNMTPCKEIYLRAWAKASVEKGGQDLNGVTTSPNGRTFEKAKRTPRTEIDRGL